MLRIRSKTKTVSGLQRRWAWLAWRPPWPVVSQAMVETGLLDWAGVADRMSVRPAFIGRLQTQGRPIEPGEPANLCLVDPAAEHFVDPARFASRSRNSPFVGETFSARPMATLLRGELTARDGKLV